jgi:hypothetical protein
MRSIFMECAWQSGLSTASRTRSARGALSEEAAFAGDDALVASSFTPRVGSARWLMMETRNWGRIALDGGSETPCSFDAGLGTPRVMRAL